MTEKFPNKGQAPNHRSKKLTEHESGYMPKTKQNKTKYTFAYHFQTTNNQR